MGKWAHLVPTDYVANIAWRKDIRLKCRDNPRLQAQVWKMCSEDVVFFCSGFLYTYDPRKDWSPVQPFILYDFQIPVVEELQDAFGNRDAIVEKSRDLGATFIMLVVLFHQWMFKSGLAILLVSRKEAMVDARGNPDCLFWKIDLFCKWLPGWMRPTTDRRQMHLENLDNTSVFSGEPTTGDIGRGGRRSCLFLDEFAAVENGDDYRALASSRDVSNCRFFNSTPRGTAGAFYDLIEKGEIPRIRLHWSEHPEKSLGLYTSKDGERIVLDRDYPYPAGYPFICDGKTRSPWYDEQCKRAANPREIAQELDIDYESAQFNFFDPAMIDEYAAEYQREPAFVGDLNYDSEGDPLDWSEHAGGMLKLWCPMNRGKPSFGKATVVIGADISEGTGSSNSALSVWSATTGELLAEYANKFIRAEEFATFSHAVSQWFAKKTLLGSQNAEIIYEAQGPGRSYGAKLIELGARFYWRENEDSTSRKKLSGKPGFWQSPDAKSMIFSSFREALAKRRINYRSEAGLKETLQYIRTSDGRVEHVKATNNDDPTAKDKLHGDIAMAAVLAYHLVKRYQPKDFNPAKPGEVSENANKPKAVASFALRRRRYEQEMAGASGTDERGRSIGW